MATRRCSPNNALFRIVVQVGILPQVPRISAHRCPRAQAGSSSLHQGGHPAHPVPPTSRRLPLSIGRLHVHGASSSETAKHIKRNQVLRIKIEVKQVVSSAAPSAGGC